MRRLLWIAALLTGLLAGSGGVAAWAYAHRGYPDVVYYSRVTVTNNSPYWSLGRYTVIQEWTDPQHHRDRIHIYGLPVPIDRVVRDGHAYNGNADTDALFAGSSTQQWIGWITHEGCGGAGTVHAGGPPVHLDIGSGYVATVLCERSHLPPFTLPADFFAPLHGTQSLWDRLLSWLTDHTGRQQVQPIP